MMSSGHPEARSPSIGAALRAARVDLERAGLESAALDAEVLLRHLLRIDRAQLFARLNDSLPIDTQRAYHRLCAARRAGTPVAYLTGEREFMGRSFAVTPAVLIPRPETEILVEWAVRWLRDRASAVIADVGTGSGAIALSIASMLPPDWPSRLIASDISPNALAVARRNRHRLGLEARVEFRQGWLLTPFSEPVDMLLANLPYLQPAQITANPALAAEPRLALDGGEAGLSLIRDLLADAPRVITPGGALGLEFDPSQRDAVIALALASFPTAAIEVLRDLAGHDRHIVVQTPAPS